MQASYGGTAPSDVPEGGMTATVAAPPVSRRGLDLVPVAAWVDRDDHAFGAFQLIADWRGRVRGRDPLAALVLRR
jgi:hypothetical protein